MVEIHFLESQNKKVPFNTEIQYSQRCSRGCMFCELLCLQRLSILNDLQASVQDLAQQYVRYAEIKPLQESLSLQAETSAHDLLFQARKH